MGAFAIAVALTSATAQVPKNDDAFQRRVRPVLENFCVDCHRKDEAEAGIDLDRFDNQEAALKDGRTWLRVRDALQGRIMPPTDEPQPSIDGVGRGSSRGSKMTSWRLNVASRPLRHRS